MAAGMVVADTAVDMGAVAGKAVPDMAVHDRVADKAAAGKAVDLDREAAGLERRVAGGCCSSWSGGLEVFGELRWSRYRAAEA